MQLDMQKAAQEFLGRGGQLKIDSGALSDPAKKALQLYKQIMASQFAAGTQDFKGAGRITQQELTQDAPSQSTMGINQSPGDFFDAVKTYRDQIAQHRAQLFPLSRKPTIRGCRMPTTLNMSPPTWTSMAANGAPMTLAR